MKNVFISLLASVLVFSFIACDLKNGEDDFISSTNDTILNNVSILGLLGTTASSSNPNVATVETPPTDKIKITSVSEGSAIITVSDGTNSATINVSVSKTGTITIGTIVKYIDNGNGDFISSTNDATLNNLSTLGLVGTTASSSNASVATVETPPTDKIKITSVSEGSAIITVSDGTNNATINISVSKTGAITIGTIIKYEISSAQKIIGTWLCDDFVPERWFKFNSNGTGEFSNEGTFSDAVTFNYTYDGTSLTITDTSAALAIPNGDYPLIMASDGLSFTISGGGQNQVYNKQL